MKGFTSDLHWANYCVLSTRQPELASIYVIHLLSCDRKSSSPASDESYDPAKVHYNPVKDACWSESSKSVLYPLRLSLCLSVSLSVRLSVFLINHGQMSNPNLAVKFKIIELQIPIHITKSKSQI